ncbi:MAG: hypothetical protein Pg6C_00240 [Treponemataceae bacterium]|nr:MAG: hypothetical protein Pg6C_00240 [Treponemataceae bacterium]
MMKLFSGLKEKIGSFRAAASGFFCRLKEKLLMRHEPLKRLKLPERDFFTRGIKNPFTLAVTGLLIVLAVAGIIAFAIAGGNEKANARRQEIIAQETKPLIFTHELLPPKEPLIPARQFADSPESADYRLFRPRVKQWSTEEAEQWFTPPGEAMFGQLHAANNMLIQNMLDAAP